MIYGNTSVHTVRVDVRQKVDVTEGMPFERLPVARYIGALPINLGGAGIQWGLPEDGAFVFQLNTGGTVVRRWGGLYEIYSGLNHYHLKGAYKSKVFLENGDIVPFMSYVHDAPLLNRTITLYAQTVAAVPRDKDTVRVAAVFTAGPNDQEAK